MSSKGRWKLDVVRIMEWQIYWFVAVVTILTGFKVWTQHCNKGIHWNRKMANSMLNSPTNPSNLALHKKKSNSSLCVVSLLLNEMTKSLGKSEILTRSLSTIYDIRNYFWKTSNCTPSPHEDNYSTTRATLSLTQSLFQKNLLQESRNFSIHSSLINIKLKTLQTPDGWNQFQTSLYIQIYNW